MAYASSTEVSTVVSPVILVLTVATANGRVTRHSYPAPQTEQGMADLVARTTGRIDDAFNPATPRGFVLENPLVIYNLDQVVSISIEGLSDSDLAEIAEKTEQKLGFQGR